MYSSVSSPPIGEIFVFFDDLKPYFCSTLIDPMLSVAALAKIAELQQGGASY
jgi:hypothetical protein